jgi:hypothetical protein
MVHVTVEAAIAQSERAIEKLVDRHPAIFDSSRVQTKGYVMTVMIPSRSLRLVSNGVSRLGFVSAVAARYDHKRRCA